MADGPILSNRFLRPFDAAKDWLTVSLRKDDGGLSAAELLTSKYFRSVVRVVADQHFATPLSDAVSRDVMTKVESATEWLQKQIQAVSGHQLSFIEPFVVPGLGVLGGQQYPLVGIQEALATKIDKTATAEDMRKASSQFNPEATREAQELSLVSTVLHEYVHVARGVQVGRNSFYEVRQGLRVNAFNARPTSKLFSALTEAAAILIESRFFTEQGLTTYRTWHSTWSDKNADGTPNMSAWKEIQALNAKTILASDKQRSISMRDRFIELLDEGGVPVTKDETMGTCVMLSFTKYGNSEARVTSGYPWLHWGMEHLATEMFRGKSKGNLDSVKMFQEMLLKAEALAEPRPVFLEILTLAKKDAVHANLSAPLDQVRLGQRYLRFFAHLRPNEPFDLMIFHAFVRADKYLPQERVASYRSELLDIYKHATEGLNLTPNTNAG